jgi:hypothetical protein
MSSNPEDTPSNGHDYDSDNVYKVPEQTGYMCKTCGEAFVSVSQREAHQKNTHQASVTVRNTLGDDIKLLRGDDGLYKCPNDWCTHTNKDSRGIRDHTRGCEHKVKKKRSSRIGPAFASLTPCGDDIQGMDPITISPQGMPLTRIFSD